MEIIDYLRILRRRWLVLVLVPLLAVVSAVAWALLKPPTHAAVSTVNGTALVGTTTSQFTGPQGVSQFVAAFGAAANGPYVLNVVSDRTSVPVRDLRDGLLVTQVGDSSTMRVAYESGKRDTVEPVLTAIVSETLVALFQPRADQSIRDRDAAAEQVEAANAEAEALAEKQGMADPRETYQALISKISNLEQQQATLRANGNAVSAVALDAPLKAARAQAATFGPILAAYATVDAKRQAAADALASAQQEYRLATGQLAATTSDRVVFISDVSSAAATNQAWSIVLPVLGAGIFTALVLAFALELLSRARMQGRLRFGAGSQAPGHGDEDGDAAGDDPDAAPVVADAPDSQPDAQPVPRHAQVAVGSAGGRSEGQRGDQTASAQEPETASQPETEVAPEIRQGASIESDGHARPARRGATSAMRKPRSR